MGLELFWSIVPFLLFCVIFLWGAWIYFDTARAPDDALQVYVVGKQWMWKIQHVDGTREMNELHVPVGRAVKLTITSEDVIHSFFVPAFRVHMDAVPGRYATLWFQATKTGRFHLFCSQYCGTNHAIMGGWVYVMEPAEYATWLSGSTPGGASAVSAGEKLFAEKFCITCHLANGTGRAPSLSGVYGAPVLLADGTTVTADDVYIRESILLPNAKIVAGYQPLMPTYQGQLTEEQILALTSYIKSLQSLPAPAKGSGIAPAPEKK